ncbi:Tim44 domain-containing protein [Sandaracinus amylolyticus]|uniref:Tim44 domain-containing protein n=1 Tax=Sandaracinus amylolyticus TaxID=927083 RepID=UPI001F3251FB|nr:Tim44 domain-containing protein [Sandaracinus amylolyticus]UJR80867.1 Hypothetical protein I5071_29170 [Sandaracinus amylolyticus]
MLARGRAAIAWLVIVGCAPSVPPVRAPSAPSTHRDPPAHVPAPESAPSTGELVGVVAAGGEDQARELLVALVTAIVEGDRETLEATLGEEVFHGGSLRAGRTRTRTSGSAFAGQLLTRARMTRLPPDARFEDLVEVESIRVEPIATSIAGEPLASELQPGDLVMHFELTSAGRDPLVDLTHEGHGALIVRPGEDPRVIAR